MKARNMPLGKKLTVVVSSLLCLLLLLSAAGLYSISQMRRHYNAAVENTAQKITLAGKLGTLGAQLDSALLGTVMYTMTQSQAQADISKASFEKTLTEMDGVLARLKTLIDDEDCRRLALETEQGMQSWRVLGSEVSAAVAASRLDEAVRLSNQRAPSLHSHLTQRVQGILSRQEQTLNEEKRSMAALQGMMRWTTLVLILAGITVGVFSLIWVLRSSRGLQNIARDIFHGADQVASASQQVSHASQALAQSSAEQAASLEQTSASTEEINSMTQKNAENAKLAAAQTSHADLILKEASQRLDSMIASMREINTSSQKISKIIKVIDEIAFQTNILALNAAVEAARAGEAGMGFAVVADEVRNLSQRCAQAAKDTSALIEESISRSNEGKQKLDEVVESIAKVVGTAAEIKILASEVHLSSQEQARGVEQIARAVTQMQQVTQSTAAHAEQSAAAGAEMSAQSQQLHDAVRLLQSLVGAGDRRRARQATGTSMTADLTALQRAVRADRGARPAYDVQPSGIRGVSRE